MEKIITGLVKSKKGVLAQLTEKLAEMDINLRSVAVAETQGEPLAYMTLVADIEADRIEEMNRELLKLDIVESLQYLAAGDHYERELLLVKLSLEENKLPHIMQISEVFRAQVAGVGHNTITLEYVGQTDQVDGFIKMLKPFGVVALARTGRTALKKDD